MKKKEIKMDKKNIQKVSDSFKLLSDDKSKENFVKGIVIKSYVPVLEKKVFLQQMFEKSLV